MKNTTTNEYKSKIGSRLLFSTKCTNELIELIFNTKIYKREALSLRINGRAPVVTLKHLFF